MYHFSDFETVKALPDTVTVLELSRAIGLSLSRTYEFLEEAKIPYLQISKRKVMFKEHLLQGLSQKRIFTDVANLKAIASLPEVFSPQELILALRVSNGFVYRLVRTPGFPSAIAHRRIVVDKQGFIRWIREKEKNIRKE